LNLDIRCCYVLITPSRRIFKINALFGTGEIGKAYNKFPFRM
jgi:hypothetical protein